MKAYEDEHAHVGRATRDEVSESGGHHSGPQNDGPKGHQVVYRGVDDQRRDDDRVGWQHVREVTQRTHASWFVVKRCADLRPLVLWAYRAGSNRVA